MGGTCQTAHDANHEWAESLIKRRAAKALVELRGGNRFVGMAMRCLPVTMSVAVHVIRNLLSIGHSLTLLAVGGAIILFGV